MSNGEKAETRSKESEAEIQRWLESIPTLDLKFDRLATGLQGVIRTHYERVKASKNDTDLQAAVHACAKAAEDWYRLHPPKTPRYSPIQALAQLELDVRMCRHTTRAAARVNPNWSFKERVVHEEIHQLWNRAFALADALHLDQPPDEPAEPYTVSSVTNALSKLAQWCKDGLKRLGASITPGGRIKKEEGNERASLASGRETKTDETRDKAKDADDLTGEEKALAMLVAHPEWTNAKIAEKAGVSRTTLYKPNWTRYKAARETLKKGRSSLPRGTKDAETGDVEAWDDDSG